MNWFHRVDWGDAPTWVAGFATTAALVFAGVQLRLDRHQRSRDEQQRRAEEQRRADDQQRSQLSAVQEATADLLGIAGYISTLANTYGLRRAAYERSWTSRPGRSVAATVHGPRLITELVETSERLLATYHRLKFSSTNERFIQAVEHLIDVVNTTVSSATGKDKWDPAPGAAALNEAATGVLDLVPHSVGAVSAV